MHFCQTTVFAHTADIEIDLRATQSVNVVNMLSLCYFTMANEQHGDKVNLIHSFYTQMCYFTGSPKDREAKHIKVSEMLSVLKG